MGSKVAACLLVLLAASVAMADVVVVVSRGQAVRPQDFLTGDPIPTIPAGQLPSQAQIDAFKSGDATVLLFSTNHAILDAATDGLVECAAAVNWIATQLGTDTTQQSRAEVTGRNECIGAAQGKGSVLIRKLP